MTPKQHEDLITEYPQLRLDAAWLANRADAALTDGGRSIYEEAAKKLFGMAELQKDQDIAYCHRMAGVRK